MNFDSFNWLSRKYPQNYIISKPLIGTLIVVIFCYLFTILYKPKNTSSTDPFSYEVTMALYTLALMPLLYLTIRGLKLLPVFLSHAKWTLRKEIGFGVLLFLILGIWNYFVGFIMENTIGRWNVYTFLDSVKTTLSVGILPYFIFTIQNSRHLLTIDAQNDDMGSEIQESTSKQMHINSKLKKGHISFDPESFLYAESNGNYVVFYFSKEKILEKEMIRNSIEDVEKQLCNIPFLIRTHRAFIVNVKKISEKKGNSSGYRLSIAGTDVELPVSRQNVAKYDQLEQDLQKSQIVAHHK